MLAFLAGRKSYAKETLVDEVFARFSDGFPSIFCLLLAKIVREAKCTACYLWKAIGCAATIPAPSFTVMN
jgi:hypothetical protein